MNLVVIGIGQRFRGDDAAGLEAVRLWRATFPHTAGDPRVRVEICELPGLALLDLLEGADAAILVDSTQSAAPPGSVRVFDEESLSAFEAAGKSAHGWGVAETLQLGRRVKNMERLVVRFVGIEMQSAETGAELSEAARGALPLACEAIQKEAERLLNE